jgi:hypothetical protein
MRYEQCEQVIREDEARTKEVRRKKYNDRRGSLPADLCDYFGSWILLLSIVTASRARALPDRLEAVFMVMLE